MKSKINYALKSGNTTGRWKVSNILLRVATSMAIAKLMEIRIKVK